MPFSDFFSSFFGDDDRPSDNRGHFPGSPPGFGGGFHSGGGGGGGADNDFEQMMQMMDQMMERAFQDFHIVFQPHPQHRPFDGRDRPQMNHVQYGHQPHQSHSGRSLRRQFLRNPDEDQHASSTSTGAIDQQRPAPVCPESAGPPGASVGPHSWSGPFTRRPMIPIFPDTPSQPSSGGNGDTDFPGANGHTHRPSHGENGNSGVLVRRPVVRTTVFSSSTVRHADGSTETKTYDRDADGHVKTRHSRQLPDQRVLTTYEERAKDGTVSTREECTNRANQPANPEVESFNLAWEKRNTSTSRPRFFDENPGPMFWSSVDQARSGMKSSWNWVKSWFQR